MDEDATDQLDKTADLKSNERASKASKAADENGNQENLDLYYKFINGRKRIAVILNHFKFDSQGLKDRKGTEIDGYKIKLCLKLLGFDEPLYYNDPNKNKIKNIIRKVSDMKASDVSCIFVVVMTHGGNEGNLYSKDESYNVRDLVDPIVTSKTLVGVPKVFLIQACRGVKKDAGKVCADGAHDEEPMKDYKLPTYADYLIMFSTVEDHVSWRSEDEGTWFIQTLSEQLKMAAEPDYRWDLLQLLIFVNSKVATYEVIDEDGITKKQIMQIETTMTKFLKFPVCKQNYKIKLNYNDLRSKPDT